MKILMTLVHGGWEYEFSNIGYPITRLIKPGSNHSFGLKGILRDNVDIGYIEDYERLANEADVIIANDCHYGDLLKDINKPKIFVPHSSASAHLFNEMGLIKYYTVVHTCQHTKDIIGDDGVVIYNGVTVENYTRYSVTDSQPNTIVGAFNNMFRRPEIGGYDYWCPLVKGYKSNLLGANNAELNDGVREGYNIERYPLELVKRRIFLNTTLDSIMPMSLYDALACGMPIVSTATCSIPEVIIHGYNGLIANDVQELRAYINLLMNSNFKCIELSHNARKSVDDYFNSDRMANDWRFFLDNFVNG